MTGRNETETKDIHSFHMEYREFPLFLRASCDYSEESNFIHIFSYENFEGNILTVVISELLVFSCLHLFHISFTFFCLANISKFLNKSIDFPKQFYFSIFTCS